MRFVSYRDDGVERIAVVRPEAATAAEVLLADDTDDTDGGGSAFVRLIRQTVEHGLASLRTAPEWVQVAGLHVIAPLPRPARNVFCVGKNYQAHVGELSRSGYGFTGGATDRPAGPTFFTKPASSVIGPGQRIDPHPDMTSALDYEAELAVIIGRGGYAIDSAHAWDHVWGYTLVNDVTARDLQRDRGQWFLGKSLDTFCPMGPFAVTADEVDAGDLTIECRVNGELRQHANTKDLIFDIPALISDLSAGITLQPGDIIATGTPSGVGLGFDPPRFLVPGDVVRVSATGMGVLENHVGAS